MTAVGEGFLPQYEEDVGGPMAWLMDRSGGEGRAVSYAVGWGAECSNLVCASGGHVRSVGRERGREGEKGSVCREERAEQSTTNRSIQLYRVYTARCTATHGDIQHQHPIDPSSWAVM